MRITVTTSPCFGTYPSTPIRRWTSSSFTSAPLSVPYAIPGGVGTWVESGECLCALLYHLQDNESYLAAGRGVVSRIVAGLGLELDAAQCSSPMSLQVAGEVGNIARHGLRLYSDLMDSNNDTVKFSRAMTLIEYLGSPGKYMRWQDLKGELIPHLTKYKPAYHGLCKRFRELTSTEDATGAQMGIRTLVVHHGRQLQDVVPGLKEREALFHELWTYCFKVLCDLVKMADKTLEDLKQHRRGFCASGDLIASRRNEEVISPGIPCPDARQNGVTFFIQRGGKKGSNKAYLRILISASASSRDLFLSLSRVTNSGRWRPGLTRLFI